MSCRVASCWFVGFRPDWFSPLADRSGGLRCCGCFSRSLLHLSISFCPSISDILPDANNTSDFILGIATSSGIQKYFDNMISRGQQRKLKTKLRESQIVSPTIMLVHEMDGQSDNPQISQTKQDSITSIHNKQMAKKLINSLRRFNSHEGML